MNGRRRPLLQNDGEKHPEQLDEQEAASLFSILLFTPVMMRFLWLHDIRKNMAHDGLQTTVT